MGCKRKRNRRKARRRRGKFKVPRHDDRTEADYVDRNNDYLVHSRLGEYIDFSGLVPRRIMKKSDAFEVYDSSKSRYGNAGIVGDPELKEGESL